MRTVIRSVGVACLAVAAAVVLVFGSTMWSGMSLAATALIMGFGETPLRIPDTPGTNISDYVNLANNYYVKPTHLCGASGCSLVAVYTTEDITNFDASNEAGRVNLDNCIQGKACTITRAPYTQTVSDTVGDNNLVVVSASQSSSVSTLEKRFLQNNPPPAGTNVSFVMVSNGNRPNGGILERLDGYPGAKQLIESLGFNVNNLTFNGATPTNTNFPTVDIANQYDPWVDFPTNPTNQLAVMNAYFGVLFAHASYLLNGGAPTLQGQYGDTTYYMYPAKYVPLLQPIAYIPVVGNLYADMADPVLRVQIEAAYDRTINPGAPTPANPNYAPDPAVFQANLAKAQLVGWDNLFQDLFLGRPFGTTRPGPYGVGGPPIYVGCGTPPCGAPTPWDTNAPAQAAVTNASTSAKTMATATVNSAEQSPPAPAPTDTTSGTDLNKKNQTTVSDALTSVSASVSASPTTALNAGSTTVAPKPPTSGNGEPNGSTEPASQQTGSTVETTPPTGSSTVTGKTTTPTGTTTTGTTTTGTTTTGITTTGITTTGTTPGKNNSTAPASKSAAG
jgi:hypothetical protein